MKRNSVFKSIVLSTVLSTFIVGCGSSTSREDSTSVNSTSITGKAVDGYIAGATVCLDLNNDGVCLAPEPMSTTDANGSFSLNVSEEVQRQDSYKDAMLLVYGGTDIDTGVDFSGKLLAPKDTKVVNITPITTLVAKAVQKELEENPDLTKEQIEIKINEKKLEVANVFDISVEDINLDPIATKNEKPELIKYSLQLQKSVESMVGANGDDNQIAEVYEKLAENLSDIDETKGLDGLLEKSFTNDEESLKNAKDISANIDKAYEKYDGDLKKVAYVTKQDLKKVESGEDVERDFENDPIFNIPESNWDREFIKADLEEIGIENPSEEDIEAIIDAIGDEDVVPGLIFDKEKEWEKEEDKESVLKLINDNKNRAQSKESETKQMFDVDSIGLKDALAGKSLYYIDSYREDSNIVYSLKTIKFNQNSISDMVEDGTKYTISVDDSEDKLIFTKMEPTGKVEKHYNEYISEEEEYIDMGVKYYKSKSAALREMIKIQNKEDDLTST